MLAGFGDYARANGELRQLLVADREAARASDEKRLQELKVKFDVDLKDRDNALLRARAAEADSRRLALSLALALSVLLLGGGALLLVVRLRAQRSSNRLLAQLASHGREMTFGLDPSAVTAMLSRQLRDMASGNAATVWLRGASGLERAEAVGSTAANDDGQASLDIARLVARCASTASEIIEPSSSPMAPTRAWRWLGRRRAETFRVFEPLLDGEQVIGVVQIDFENGRRYRNRERQIVRTTCLYAAVALANIRTAQLLSESQVKLEQQHTREVQAQAETLRETNGRLEQLASIGQEITRQLSESGVVHSLERNIDGLLQNVALTVFPEHAGRRRRHGRAAACERCDGRPRVAGVDRPRRSAVGHCPLRQGAARAAVEPRSVAR